MPLLTYQDPLASTPRRILVAGTSGSGKSTLAVRISTALDLPYVELDSLFHGPSWTPRDSFEADVEAFSAGPRWVTEWQYRQVRSLLAARADLLVWLDLSRARVISQLAPRTLRRRLRRQLLWNDNVEPPLRSIFTDPDHVIRWAWRTHAQNARRVRELAHERPDLPIVRIRSRRQADEWITTQLRAARPQNG
jgi:adenylate kinase family enzyme